jgi:hypothetical protein
MYLQEVMASLTSCPKWQLRTVVVLMADRPALLCDLSYQSRRCMARLLLSPKLMHARDAEPHHSPDGLATATHSSACCCMACALFPLTTHLSWVKFCNCWYAGSASHPIALLLRCQRSPTYMLPVIDTVCVIDAGVPLFLGSCARRAALPYVFRCKEHGQHHVILRGGRAGALHYPPRRRRAQHHLDRGLR